MRKNPQRNGMADDAQKGKGEEMKMRGRRIPFCFAARFDDVIFVGRQGAIDNGNEQRVEVIGVLVLP